MMLPDELEWVLEMLGYNWPTADEDKLRDSAELWRRFGDDVARLHESANSAARNVTAYNAGESIDAFTKTYAKFDGGNGSDGYLANAAQAAYIIANVMEACAYIVEFAKWAVIAQLIALAIQIAAAQLAAPFTFGLSEIGALGATQATRLIVRRLLDELKDALIEAIVEAMKEPAVSAIEAIITDLVRQTVNVGFGAQQGFDLSQTAKAGVEGGWEAVQQTPQTLAEGVRDSLGAKAGSRARHAIDSRIDGYDGDSGTSGSDGGGGGGGSDSSSNSSSGSSSSSSSDSSSGSSSDSSSSSSSSSDSGSSGSDSSASTRSGNGAGVNIGGGISADGGGGGIGTPDVGAGPSSDSGSGSGSGAGQNPSASDTPAPRPTPSLSGPTLSDFDDPAPGGTSSGGSNSGGSSGTPSTSGPSHTGGGPSVSSISSPSPQSAPTAAPSGGTSSSSPGGGAIGTSIDSLAATVPTQSNAAPTPTATDPSPAGAGGGGRADGGSTTPTSPVAPSTGGASVPGTHPGSGASGGTPSAASPTSPTPNSGPTRNPSAGTPGTPSPTGTGPASTPSPTSSTTTPRSTPTPTPEGRTPGTDGRTPSTPAPTPDGRIPTQRTPGTPQGDESTPRNTPGNTPSDRTSSRTSPDPTGTRTSTPGQNPSTSTPTTTPTTTPSASTGTGTGTGSDRTSTPGTSNPNSSTRPGPAQTPSTSSTPSTSGTSGTPSTSGTPGTQNQPSASTPATPTRPPQQPAGSTPSPPNTPNPPQQPAAQPHTPQNTPPTPQQQQQQQQQVTAVPIHTVVTTPGSSTPPSHAAPATPHPPGSPQATPGDPNHQQQPQQQDSLEDIRSDLDHYPGGLSEPDPADQQALVDAVPRNEDGTPERFPDPFGSWSQLQNDGGTQVPGRSNNCADCSRSFLETWYGNPQVSAARTPDYDENGKHDPYTPEDNANDNQIRWAGAAHTYAGPGGDPETANNIASVLQQAGHGSAAIVQVDWPNGGGGHAFNVVNHNGNIVWIDTQSGEVSNEPLHLADAEHVWHIPLDADRNPIDTTQSGTDDTTDSDQGTGTPQDGIEASQQEADNSPAGNENQKTPESAPSAETSRQETDPSHEETDRSEQETNNSAEGTQDQQATQSAPSGETPDHGSSEAPDNATSEDSDPAPTPDPERPDPLPATATRDQTPPGGVTDPTPAEQEALDNSVPRDENGDPTAPPEPPDGPWVQHVNGDGADAPGRNNNCVDVALSTVDTIAGNPTVAGARTPDLDADGNPSDRGEKAGRDRIENTLGARFTDLGNGRDAFNRLEDTLRNSGHGSQAVIITQDANGRAHAWNAVNHNGRVTYIDAQTGRTSPYPLHNGSKGVFAIPLDANRRPVAPDRTGPTDSGKPDADRRNAGTTAEPHAGRDRRPPADPAGQQSDGKEADKKQAGLEEHPDDLHPRLERERGDTTTLRSNLPPDDAQVQVRVTNPVFRLQHGHVDQQLHEWAKNGRLAHVLRVAAGDTTDPHASPDRPRTFTAAGLEKALPGFSSLNRGEQMLVVSTLARLSDSAHEQYGVNKNPMENGTVSEGVIKHRSPSGPVRKMMERFGDPENHIPDLTERNFAVVEIRRDDGTIEYVTDSSYPPPGNGVGGKHSERHLADWIDEVNKAYATTGRKYEITALYTEREPCGDKKGGLGKDANCSNLLGEALAGKPVYYSTTYRADEEQTRAERTRELQKQRRIALNLTPNAPLPEEEKKRITEQVKKEHPATNAEKERDREIKQRVRKVRALWKTIAPQL